MSATEVRKAAVMLLSLPPKQAADMLGRLNAQEVETVAMAIASSDTVSPEERESVAREFSTTESTLAGRGGVQRAKSLVERSHGHRHPALRRLAASGRAFEALQYLDTQKLLPLIRDEYPQTIALVIANLNADRGAEILAGLPLDLQATVIKRIAAMGRADRQSVREVESALAARVSRWPIEPLEPAGGVAAAAEILGATDLDTQRNVMAQLAKDGPDFTEALRRRMFVFEQVLNFPDKDIQTISRHVSTGQWATALQGAGEPILGKLLANMSQRAAAMLKQEIEYARSSAHAEIEQARRQIIETTRRLADAGEIGRDHE